MSSLSFTWKKKSAFKKNNPLFEESSSDEQMDTDGQNISVSGLLEKALNAVNNGNIGKSILLFSDILSHPQSNIDDKCKSHDMIAQLLLDQNQITRAIEHCNSGLELSKNYYFLYQTLARCQRNIGELDVAISNFEKALDLDPSNSELQSDISECKELIEKCKPKDKSVEITNREIVLTNPRYNVK